MSEVGLKLKKLGELVEIHNNKRIPLSSKERANLSKIYPYYGAQGIVDYVDNYIFDGKNILIAEDGENLKSNNKSICTLATGKYWVNNHAHIVRANNENDTDYLFYKLNSISFLPYITGSAQPKLNKENLLNIPVYVHEKAEQKNISKLLSKIDQKIALNNQINEELEAMAKTLYDYWFVQFDFPDQNGKPYKSSGGKMVYHPELKREIPEGWGVDSLWNIATFYNGLAMQKFRPASETDESLPVIKIREMFSGFSKDTEKASTAIPKEAIIEAGDILFSWSATLEVILWGGEKGALNQHIFKVTSEKYPKSFIYNELRSYLKVFKTIAELRKTTMGHITQDHLKQAMIIVPPNDLIDEIHNRISPILKQQLDLKQQNQELTQLRDWLLPMLMNGQVKVEDKT
ncbi:restriction endonuclease subunit S [Streptococcus sp. VTCC 12905]|uniref:restriction endonuclease subunit S n=1 Tax=Streptococcus sp. VTCC 12905 TaxID=3413768 RepID=UPI003D9C6E05